MWTEVTDSEKELQTIVILDNVKWFPGWSLGWKLFTENRLYFLSDRDLGQFSNPSHRVPTPTPPSSTRGKAGRKHLNEEITPPPPNWDRRAIQPKHIKFRTVSGGPLVNSVRYSEIRVQNTDFVQKKLFKMARQTACLNVSILQEEVAEKCGRGRGGGSGELWLRCWLLAVVDGCCSSLELVGFSPRKGSSQAARYPTIFGWFTWTENYGLTFSH